MDIAKLRSATTLDVEDIRSEDRNAARLTVERQCALCGRPDNLMDRHEKPLCQECVREIRHEPECAVCGRLDDLVELHDRHVCRDGAHEPSIV